MHWFNKGAKCYYIFLLLIAASSCNHEKKIKPTDRPQGNAPVIVDVIIASRQSISNIIEANGTVVANEYVELHPEVSGRLTYLNVPEGRYIAKGTVIARVNAADLQAQVEKSRVQLDLAQKTEERNRQLIAVNGINQSDYDIAQNQVSSAKADISYTQALIDKTVIKAPFSGIVGLRQVSPGASVTPTTIVASIQQVNKSKIDFTLPEENANIVKKGGTVEVEIDAAQPERKKAVIIAIEPQVNQTTRNIMVRAMLQNGKGNPGAFVKVYVNAGADKNVIKVPTNSVIPNDKSSQLILAKNGKALFADVQTGIRDANTVEITNGISVGDSVVITGVLFARPKSTLKIRKVLGLDEYIKGTQ